MPHIPQFTVFSRSLKAEFLSLHFQNQHWVWIRTVNLSSMCPSKTNERNRHKRPLDFFTCSDSQWKPGTKKWPFWIQICCTVCPGRVLAAVALSRPLNLCLYGPQRNALGQTPLLLTATHSGNSWKVRVGGFLSRDLRYERAEMTEALNLTVWHWGTHGCQ